MCSRLGKCQKSSFGHFFRHPRVPWHSANQSLAQTLVQFFCSHSCSCQHWLILKKNERTLACYFFKHKKKPHFSCSKKYQTAQTISWMRIVWSSCVEKDVYLTRIQRIDKEHGSGAGEFHPIYTWTLDPASQILYPGFYNILEPGPVILDPGFLISELRSWK